MNGISIRGSLGVLVLATALPFVALLAYTAYSRAQFLAEQAGAEALRAARGAATETETTLERARQLLAALAARPNLKSLDAAKCAPIFPAFIELYPEYTNLQTIHRDGSWLCSAINRPPDAPQKVDPSLYLSETLRSGTFTVSRVFRGITSRRWFAILAYPITDPQGEIQSVAGVSIDLASLRLVPRPDELPPQARALMVDANGTVVSANAEPGQRVGQNLAAVPWIAKRESGREVIRRAADEHGKELIYATAPIKYTTWQIAVGIPLEVVYGPVWKGLIRDAVFSLVALLLAATLAYLIGRRTSRPIEAIAAIVRRATQPPFSSSLEPLPVELLYAPQEVQTLAGDFRVMLEARATAELQLRESEEGFRLAVEAAPNGTLLVGEDGRVVLANAQARRLFGYSIGELSGMEVERLIPATVRTQHVKDRAGFFADPKARAMGEGRDLYGLRKDGSVVPVEIGLAPVRIAGKTCALASIVDITDRKQKAERLQQANEALERSNIELQRFAYVASHDLQTPLRGISGFVQLLQSKYAGRLDEKADDWIRRTVNAVEQMRTLTKDLLEFSRVDAEPHPFERVFFKEIFDQTASLLDASIRETGAALTHGELPQVSGDRSQLVHLMLNLIGNALKYRSGRVPRIHVFAEKGTNEWVFSVRDNGIGIAAKYHDRIFEIFQRLHGNEEYPGTGIGLAICRRVVHRHGGRIWVQSVPSEGSTFYFTIPERTMSDP